VITDPVAVRALSISGVVQTATSGVHAAEQIGPRTDRERNLHSSEQHHQDLA
jgi:hypothetical protein